MGYSVALGERHFKPAKWRRFREVCIVGYSVALGERHFKMAKWRRFRSTSIVGYNVANRSRHFVTFNGVASGRAVLWDIAWHIEVAILSRSMASLPGALHCGI